MLHTPSTLQSHLVSSISIPGIHLIWALFLVSYISFLHNSFQTNYNLMPVLFKSSLCLLKKIAARYRSKWQRVVLMLLMRSKILSKSHLLLCNHLQWVQDGRKSSMVSTCCWLGHRSFIMALKVNLQWVSETCNLFLLFYQSYDSI